MECDRLTMSRFVPFGWLARSVGRGVDLSLNLGLNRWLLNGHGSNARLEGISDRDADVEDCGRARRLPELGQLSSHEGWSREGKNMAFFGIRGRLPRRGFRRPLEGLALLHGDRDERLGAGVGACAACVIARRRVEEGSDTA